MWIHTATSKVFENWDQLRLWLVKEHFTAIPSDASDLLDVLASFGVSPYADPAITSLEYKQASVWSMIKAERERRRFNGVSVAGKWFHTDPDSRTQHLSMIIMGANLPIGIEWKTMDGSKIIMTPAIVGQIFAGELSMEIANFAVAEAHDAAMRKLADPTDYDFSTGWTATFEPAA